MKIENDSKTLARRDTWRRDTARTRPSSVSRLASAPTMPSLSLAELLNRLSQGHHSPLLAGNLLRAGSTRITLHLEIDRDTGLVGRWDLRLEDAEASDDGTVPEQIAPAA